MPLPPSPELVDSDTTAQASTLDIFDSTGRKVHFGSLFETQKTVVVFIREVHIAVSAIYFRLILIRSFLLWSTSVTSNFIGHTTFTIPCLLLRAVKSVEFLPLESDDNHPLLGLCDSACESEQRRVGTG